MAHQAKIARLRDLKNASGLGGGEERILRRSRGGQAINLVDWPKMRSMASAIHNGTMASYSGR